mmetsp:Transcript_74420/g.131957  ORF Transcript_74420/g.131957 Transcript_74420/m.131957 type:complete len:211 (-) Transcript_74420:24-656(-)
MAMRVCELREKLRVKALHNLHGEGRELTSEIFQVLTEKQSCNGWPCGKDVHSTRPATAKHTLQSNCISCFEPSGGRTTSLSKARELPVQHQQRTCRGRAASADGAARLPLRHPESTGKRQKCAVVYASEEALLLAELEQQVENPALVEGHDRPPGARRQWAAAEETTGSVSQLAQKRPNEHKVQLRSSSPQALQLIVGEHCHVACLGSFQ